MPTIKTRTTMVANGTAFPLQGNQYEYLPFDAYIEMALKADAAGVVNATVFSGSDLLLQSAQIDTLAVATPIQYPEDFEITDAAAGGERLGIQLQEAGGLTPIVRTVTRITPL